MLCSVIAPPLLQASRQLLPKRSSAALLYHVDVHVAPGGSISSVPDVGFSCLLRPKENGDGGVYKPISWGVVKEERTVCSHLCNLSWCCHTQRSWGWFHVTDPGCSWGLTWVQQQLCASGMIVYSSSGCFCISVCGPVASPTVWEAVLNVSHRRRSGNQLCTGLYWTWKQKNVVLLP